ncbi:MAG: UvrD-helicase domain-containing protein [Enterobacterales bacterium]|nr:UvrD-helicase domain-containing protein [Enterobacterales bacterium]
MPNHVVDQAIRDEVLDISQSFILQAPAGSGKTELLTQRILALLAVVKQPESILAITFTRKAAAEMRQRVMDALKAASEDKPQTAHELKRWHLAKKVLQADQKLQWNLMKNPSRLNLYTIDALSAKLAIAQPLLSQTGTLPEIEQQPKEMYQQAAENCLKALSNQDKLGDNIRALLSYKDNNLESVIELLAQLLAKRVQWLGRFDAKDHQLNCQQMLHALQQMTLSKMQHVYQLLPANIVAELPDLLKQVSELYQQIEKKQDEEICQLHNFSAIKSPVIEDFILWKSIAKMLLKKGEIGFYKKVNKSHGFPTAKDAINSEQEALFIANKDRITEMLDDLREQYQVAKSLDDLRKIPTDLSRSIEHPVLTAVVEILPYVAAHLRLVFQQQNKIDFSELSLAAINALGASDEPSDLALALDYKIEHILLDEFQDTSSPQIELLKLLTSGWDNSGNKSLFLVGDPMQSIYRFRDANVSLFLKVIEQGVGDIQLEFRQLKVNFRSNEAIIDWVNQQFSQIMPEQDDIFLSAVSYTPSVAFHAKNSHSKVEILSSVINTETTQQEDGLEQRHKMLQIIKQHLQDNRQNKTLETLAVLAKSKSHVRELCLELSRQQIAYQAVELVKLADRMVVQDVTRLALALTDVYDSISWLACFRSPWFALSLDDIFAIEKMFKQSNKDYLMCLAELLQTSKNHQSMLTIEGHARVEKLLPILQYAIAQKTRKPFKKWLLGSFKAVGGLNQIQLESDYMDLETCVDTLVEFQQGGELLQREPLFEALNELYSAPDPSADQQVQIMTIHKSKGLEFDKVILPQIHRKSGRHDAPLLKWTELVNDQGSATHILALSKETGEENDPLYDYIGDLEKQKSVFELQRLLYVAATRAKTKLYAFCRVEKMEIDEGDTEQQLPPFQQYKPPVKGSFLSLLWPSLEQLEIIHNSSSISSAANKLSIEEERSDSVQNILETDLQNVERLTTAKQQLSYIFPTRKIKQCDLQFVASQQQVAQDINVLLNQVDSQTAVEQFALNANPLVLARRNYADQSSSQSNTQSSVLTESLDNHQSAAIIGRVIHAQFEWLSQQPQLPKRLPSNWLGLSRGQLVQAGLKVNNPELDYYTKKVQKAVEQSLQDDKGRFILSHKTDAASELVLQKSVSNIVQTRIVDRCFIEKDLRWIIDYKSSEPEANQTQEDFIEQQIKQYKPQLESYADLFRKMETRSIVAALYFPMISHLAIVIDER